MSPGPLRPTIVVLRVNFAYKSTKLFQMVTLHLSLKKKEEEKNHDLYHTPNLITHNRLCCAIMA